MFAGIPADVLPCANCQPSNPAVKAAAFSSVDRIGRGAQSRFSVFRGSSRLRADFIACHRPALDDRVD
jgi:hypothetical protein